jgi:nucleotidyltransferase substrate binding protein (TIGR01987 family)
MPNQKLILTPLKKALRALQEALLLPKNDITRDATIQRFEYTFELTWKFLKRHLSQEAGIKEYSIKNLFRDAAQANLIDNIEAWFGYLEARNLTSHTYNEKTANETYQAAKHFAVDADKLLNKFEVFYGDTTD